MAADIGRPARADIDLTPYSRIGETAWFAGAGSVLIIFGWMVLVFMVSAASRSLAVAVLLGGGTLLAIAVLFVTTSIQRLSSSTAGTKRPFLLPEDRAKPAPGFDRTFGEIVDQVAALKLIPTRMTAEEARESERISAGQRAQAIAYAAGGFLVVLIGVPLILLLRLGGGLLAPAVMLLVGGMYALFNRGRRAMLQSAETVTRYDRRPPILFLRSFRDDKVRLMQRVNIAGLPGAQGLRLEEALAFMIRGLGPFLAVGEPGEGLPQLGAARAYLADDKWQAQVSAWIRAARFIVMQCGPTKWIHWEMQNIIANERIGHLLLVLPPGRKPGSKADRDRRLRWDNIVRSLEATPYGPALKALDVGDVLLVQFLADHGLRVYRSRGDLAQDYELAMTLAIYAATGRGAPAAAAA
jgi:hypothetical protein